ncbi:ribosome biogenesis GTPase RsgA [Petrotoga sp. 9T1HF07.CasAA.8.2]|uniref:ribosome small subunit-dependent GTPase A n=1 Tax=Petrotoga sp. 9T1HF07.CasAA.8.2 TaxID=1434329 RepID=UPI000CB070EF|nr:ribosome small subunit-dependent GTPase A [Petrotoga sp. 9T1HF07.CasAA.8.2]PNR87828.1 ribosome biogenesis GTPase RsgA [Petrotoga sp. 9T1HF07.CasAA.8.2]
MSWRKGIVVRFHSDMVTVQDLESNQKINCFLPGRFKLQKIRPIVGDYVEYSKDQHNTYGRIENILERKNELYRPRVANLDQLVLVTSIKEPQVDLIVVDKIIVLAEKEKLDVVIVLNKTDLLGSDEEKREMERFIEIYGKIYPVIPTSKLTKNNLDILKSYLKNKVSTFAGPSGVGKSSLLNVLDPKLKLREGEISKKLGRGKHTTTYAELLYFDFGGYIVDTPGFSSLELRGIKKDEVRRYFREFLEFDGFCQFSNCSHTVEPGCAIKEAVENGQISLSRYTNYCQIYEEIEDSSLKLQ